MLLFLRDDDDDDDVCFHETSLKKNGRPKVVLIHLSMQSVELDVY